MRAVKLAALSKALPVIPGGKRENSCEAEQRAVAKSGLSEFLENVARQENLARQAESSGDCALAGGQVDGGWSLCYVSMAHSAADVGRAAADSAGVEGRVEPAQGALGLPPIAAAGNELPGDTTPAELLLALDGEAPAAVTADIALYGETSAAAATEVPASAE